MRTPEQIKKEIASLEIELRILRNKGLDLEADINKKENLRFSLENVIIKTRANADQVKANCAELVRKETELSQNNRNIIASANSKLAELRKESDRIDAKKFEVEDLIVKNKEIEGVNLNILSTIKNERKELSDDKAALDREKQEHSKVVKQNEELKARLEDKIEATKKLNEETNQKNIALDNKIREQENLNIQVDAGLIDLENKRDILDEKIEEYNQKVEEVIKEKIKSEKLNEDLKKATSLAQAEKSSFEKTNAELGVERNRIEIFDLKVQKLARDKGLVEELAKLRKELNEK